MNLSIPMMVSPLGRLQCFSYVRSPLKSPSQCPSRNDRSFKVGELWWDEIVENVTDTPPIRRGSNRMFSRCFWIIVFWGLVTGSVKVHIGSSARVNKVQQAFSKGSARVQQVLTRISTRLNSSHVAISYAVFCLKNKTTPKLKNKNKIE